MSGAKVRWNLLKTIKIILISRNISGLSNIFLETKLRKPKMTAQISLKGH